MKNDGGHAYPQNRIGGLTVRDHFAGMAIQGICRDAHFGAHEAGAGYWVGVAKIAYDLADAMIAAREKP